MSRQESAHVFNGPEKTSHLKEEVQFPHTHTVVFFVTQLCLSVNLLSGLSCESNLQPAAVAQNTLPVP